MVTPPMRPAHGKLATHIAHAWRPALFPGLKGAPRAALGQGGWALATGCPGSARAEQEAAARVAGRANAGEQRPQRLPQARSARHLGLLGRRRPGGRRRDRRGRLGSASAVTPTHERTGLAGVLIKDDEVEEKVALHVLLADRVFRDALPLGPIGNVFVEQLLGVVGGPFLAVIVHGVGEALALGRGRGRYGTNHDSAGTGSQRACGLRDHGTPPSTTPPPTYPIPIAARDGLCLVLDRYWQGLRACCH